MGAELNFIAYHTAVNQDMENFQREVDTFKDNIVLNSMLTVMSYILISRQKTHQQVLDLIVKNSL